MRYLPSVLWHCWLGGTKGIRPVKNGGDGGGGHWLVRMEWGAQPEGRCVPPLLIFHCTIKSRSSFLAPAHPGGPGKRAVKRFWCGGWVQLCIISDTIYGLLDYNHRHFFWILIIKTETTTQLQTRPKSKTTDVYFRSYGSMSGVVLNILQNLCGFRVFRSWRLWVSIDWNLHSWPLVWNVAGMWPVWVLFWACRYEFVCEQHLSSCVTR